MPFKETHILFARQKGLVMLNPTFIPNNQPCPEQARLAIAAIKSGERVIDAKAELDRTTKVQKGIGAATLILSDLRKIELLAIAARNLHQSRHGCCSFKLRLL